MTKHIVCHYSNGSLLFSTSENFTPGVSQMILDIFKQQGLVASLEPNLIGSYRIVGKMNLNYDPFEKGQTKWNELISRMSITKRILEDRLKPLFAQRTTRSATAG